MNELVMTNVTQSFADLWGEWDQSEDVDSQEAPTTSQLSLSQEDQRFSLEESNALFHDFFDNADGAEPVVDPDKMTIVQDFPVRFDDADGAEPVVDPDKMTIVQDFPVHGEELVRPSDVLADAEVVDLFGELDLNESMSLLDSGAETGALDLFGDLDLGESTSLPGAVADAEVVDLFGELDLNEGKAALTGVADVGAAGRFGEGGVEPAVDSSSGELFPEFWQAQEEPAENRETDPRFGQAPSTIGSAPDSLSAQPASTVEQSTAELPFPEFWRGQPRSGNASLDGNPDSTNVVTQDAQLTGATSLTIDAEAARTQYTYIGD